jgi:hypothetical protein
MVSESTRTCRQLVGIDLKGQPRCAHDARCHSRPRAQAEPTLSHVMHITAPKAQQLRDMAHRNFCSHEYGCCEGSSRDHNVTAAQLHLMTQGRLLHAALAACRRAAFGCACPPTPTTTPLSRGSKHLTRRVIATHTLQCLLAPPDPRTKTPPQISANISLHLEGNSRVHNAVTVQRTMCAMARRQPLCKDPPQPNIPRA